MLEVPEGTGWYNALYTTLLKGFRRWHDTKDMDQDEAEVRKVEEIVNARPVRRVTQYRVRWAACTVFVDT